MNDVDIVKIQGIINTVAGCDNFIEKYEIILGSNVYFYESLDLTFKYGLILITNNKKKSINIPISIKSYLNLKTLYDEQYIDIQTIHSLINIISNSFDINIIMGFIKDVNEDYFESYIILENMGKFVCVNIPITDIFAMKEKTKFPVFINREIIEKRGIDYSEFLEHIDITMWRVFSG